MDKEDPSAHNLVVEDGGLEPTSPPLMAQSQLAETIVDNEFQSQPSSTITYTHNGTLE